MTTTLQERTAPAEGGFFAPRRLGHANLYVGDVDRAVDFYVHVAGFEISYLQPLNKAGFVGNGNTHHDFGLIDIHGPLARGRGAGLNHLAFELETEIDLVEGYRRALEAGRSFARTVDHDIAHSLYGPDPDGNQIEIYADVVHDWRTQRSGIVTKPKPAWSPGSTPPTSARNYHVDPEIRRVADAVFHPRRTAHAALVVSDLAQAFRHYTGLVGLRALAGGPESAFAVLGGTTGERSLYLLPAGAGSAPGLHHVGIEVADEAELDGALERLAARGRAPELHVEHGLRRSVFVRDPDGTRLRFFVERDRAASLAGLEPGLVPFVA